MHKNWASLTEIGRRELPGFYTKRDEAGEFRNSGSGHKGLFPYLLLSLLFLLIVIPLVLETQTGVDTAKDEMLFHYPTVLDFAEQFPTLNLRSYDSATTPLYHLLLMGVVLVAGPNLILLRFVTAIISFICLLFVYYYLSLRGGRANAFAFTLVFMLSPYFIGPSVMLFTDNLALLFIFLSIWMLDYKASFQPKWIWANVFAALGVLTRQIHIWLAGVTFLLALWRPREEQGSKPALSTRLKNALPALLPVGVLALFVLLWGGLTPTRFQGKHESGILVNLGAITYMVSLLGLYGGCLAVWYWQLFRPKMNRRNLIHIALLVALGLLYLRLNPYAEMANSDESSGALWRLAVAAPTLFSTSIVYWIFFPLGLVLLYVTGHILIARKDYAMAASLPLWILTNVAHDRTYQRYFEPFLLFVISYTLVTLDVHKSRSRWIGPILLMVGLAFMSFVRLALQIVT
jgi:hypothetical protein